MMNKPSVLHEMLEKGRRNRERAKGGRRFGRMPRHQLDGRAVSMREIARELGVSAQAIEWQMKRKGRTLEEAMAYFRRKRRDAEYQDEAAAREARAVDEIMRIITEG